MKFKELSGGFISSGRIPPGFGDSDAAADGAGRSGSSSFPKISSLRVPELPEISSFNESIYFGISIRL